MPKKRKPTAKKVGKKAAAASPERDTKQSAPRQAATKAKARRAKKPALRPRVRVAAQRPDVTHEKALRDDLGKEDGPAREREQPEELIRGAADDDLAEELGEEFVQSATSGEQAAQDIRDEEVPEESGGPFVETSGRSEFAYGTDASNPKDAERAPFPTTRREK
ncbi:MAG TPA: hypothetical protein VII08_00330 [Myxococcales bacterium]